MKNLQLRLKFCTDLPTGWPDKLKFNRSINPVTIARLKYFSELIAKKVNIIRIFISS